MFSSSFENKFTHTLPQKHCIFTGDTWFFKGSLSYSFQAIDRRDALSKFIYADLFEWLVVQINKSFEVGELMITGRSISILDIYGFESFKVYKSYLSVW